MPALKLIKPEIAEELDVIDGSVLRLIENKNMCLRYAQYRLLWEL